MQDVLLLRLPKRGRRLSNFNTSNRCVYVSIYANNLSLDEVETRFTSVVATVCAGEGKCLDFEKNSKIWSGIVANCLTEFIAKVGARIVRSSGGNRKKTIS